MKRFAFPVFVATQEYDGIGLKTYFESPDTPENGMACRHPAVEQ